MVFQFVSPKFGPGGGVYGVELAHGGQASDPMEFFVPSNETDQTFLRVIALNVNEFGGPRSFPNQVSPFGCRAPIFEIKGGPSKFTEVRPGTGEVDIATSEGFTVATARCQPGPGDSYLISITNIVKNATPWYLRVESTDPQPLNYVVVSSHREVDTLQPRMQFQGFGGRPLTDREAVPTFGPQPALFMSMFNEAWEISPKRSVIFVRNFGTAGLEFRDEAGTPVGGPDSPIVVKAIRVTDAVGEISGDPIPPGGHGILHLERLPDFPLTVAFERPHTFTTNDLVPEHATLTVKARPTGATPSPTARQSDELVRDTSRASSHCPCGCHSYRPDPDGICFCGHNPMDHYHNAVHAGL